MNPVPRGPVKKDKPAGNATAALDAAPRSRSKATRITLAICAGLLFAGFFALGTWQLKRLQWKLDLIQRVEQRVHAPAVSAPGISQWPQITAESDEYRHVSLSGNYLYALTTRVQAATELGGGFWLLTPLRTADGSTVLINRGFISGKTPEQSQPAEAGAAGDTVTVTGLLRITEPGGGFLRHNDPAGNRWYSRDVQAIAAARGLSRVAPYFVDADATKATTGGSVAAASPDNPVGGLTVITFHNSHLVYALTWYALALMVAGAYCRVVREERKLPHKTSDKHTGASDDRIDSESEDGKQN